MATLSVFDAAREAPDRVAVSTATETVTYADLAARAAATVRALEDAPAGPLAFVARADLATIVLMSALLSIGRPFVPLHPRWTDVERSEAVQRLDETGSFGARAVSVDPLDVAAPSTGAFEGPEPRGVDEAEIGVCLFTSGSAAAPKGVLLERRALLASARAHAANLAFRPDDRWLVVMPFAHAGGLSILTRAISSRTAVVLRERFDPQEVRRVIGEEDVTLASFVPAMLHAVLEAGGERELRRLRAVLVGGATLSSGLRARARAAGVRALATYGLTETASQIATQRPAEPLSDDPLVVGPPLEGAQIEIRDNEGRALDPGIEGRIWVRGPMLMRGYAGGPCRAAEAWLDTGDRGSLGDDGVLSVLGRADDTIVTGGENVHPTEVEAALSRVPGVRASAVFGVPDPVWGQVVAAALVVDPSCDAAAACKALGLATFKRPRLFVAVEALPLSPNGKVERRALPVTLAGLLKPVG